MSKIKGNISDAVLAYDRTNWYIVAQGFVASAEKREIKLVVKDDVDRVLEHKQKMIPKSDVDTGVAVKREQMETLFGYRLEIPMPEDWKQIRTIQIFAEDPKDGQSVKLYQTSMQALKKRYDKEVLMMHIEGWKKNEESSVIRGWAFHKEAPFELKLYNADGTEIKAQTDWIRRQELERIFLINNTEKTGYGFTANIDNSELKSDKVKLVVASGDKKKQETIDLSKEKKRDEETLASKLVNPKKWVKAALYLKNYGPAAFIDKVKNVSDNPDVKYHKWFVAHRITKGELDEQRKHTFEHNPKISIVIPLYNTRIEFLKDIIDSVLNQSYGNLELCLADGSTKAEVGEYIKANYHDDRLVYQKLEKNEGIAGNTNAALKMATGDFVVLSDHDDILELDALYEIVKLYNENPSLDIIYTDEDLTDETGKRFMSPRFKPDYNEDFLCSVNYICHIFAVKKNIMDEVGGFRTEYDGAQDWDLILRCCEKSENIGHVAKILYHWRAHQESTAGNIDSKQYAIDAGRKAVEDHFKRIGVEAELDYTGIFILFRPKLIPKSESKVSIIIPNKDEKETLKTCVDSILEKTTYKNYEIIIVENNSTSEEIFDYYKELENDTRIKVVQYQGEFNYSKINNFGATYATGEYLVLLNNDTELISEDWLERMLGYCQRENTGIVGAKLYYPDDTVQHSGIVVGVGGFAGHVLTGSNRSDAGYFGRLKAAQEISAVTAACFMVKRSVFDAVGGLDEDFIVALNDVDFCLKVRAQGKKVVLDPGIELYHYESKSRGFEETPEKHERFKKEIKRFRDKWAAVLEQGDPYYNKNLSLMYGDCRMRESEEAFAIVEEISEEING